MAKEVYRAKHIPEGLQLQIEITDLTVDDVARLERINQLIDLYDEGIIDNFYNKMLSIGQFKKIIEKHSSVEKLKTTMKRHLATMFTENLNEDYLYEENKLLLSIT